MARPPFGGSFVQAPTACARSGIDDPLVATAPVRLSVLAGIVPSLDPMPGIEDALDPD